ncbi:hypothetical protein BC833DRAFT_580137 [Globomyces pollinis-pini]|nr:hypothetical protein BC833DRAFT_580137 [Globomyces pollinis-pini]
MSINELQSHLDWIGSLVDSSIDNEDLLNGFVFLQLLSLIAPSSVDLSQFTSPESWEMPDITLKYFDTLTEGIKYLQSSLPSTIKSLYPKNKTMYTNRMDVINLSLERINEELIKNAKEKEITACQTILELLHNVWSASQPSNKSIAVSEETKEAKSNTTESSTNQQIYSRIQEEADKEDYISSERTLRPMIRWLLHRTIQCLQGRTYKSLLRELERAFMLCSNEDSIAIPKPVIQILCNCKLYNALNTLLFHPNTKINIESFESKPVDYQSECSFLKDLTAKGYLNIQESLLNSVKEMIKDSNPFYESIHINIISAFLANEAKLMSIDPIVEYMGKTFPDFNESQNYPYDIEDALLMWMNQCLIVLKQTSDFKDVNEFEELSKDLDDGWMLCQVLEGYFGHLKDPKNVSVCKSNISLTEKFQNFKILSSYVKKIQNRTLFLPWLAIDMVPSTTSKRRSLAGNISYLYIEFLCSLMKIVLKEQLTFHNLPLIDRSNASAKENHTSHSLTESDNSCLDKDEPIDQLKMSPVEETSKKPKFTEDIQSDITPVLTKKISRSKLKLRAVSSKRDSERRISDNLASPHIVQAPIETETQCEESAMKVPLDNTEVSDHQISMDSIVTDDGFEKESDINTLPNKELIETEEHIIEEVNKYSASNVEEQEQTQNDTFKTESEKSGHKPSSNIALSINNTFLLQNSAPVFQTHDDIEVNSRPHTVSNKPSEFSNLPKVILGESKPTSPIDSTTTIEQPNQIDSGNSSTSKAQSDDLESIVESVVTKKARKSKKLKKPKSLSRILEEELEASRKFHKDIEQDDDFHLTIPNVQKESLPERLSTSSSTTSNACSLPLIAPTTPSAKLSREKLNGKNEERLILPQLFPPKLEHADSGIELISSNSLKHETPKKNSTPATTIEDSMKNIDIEMTEYNEVPQINEGNTDIIKISKNAMKLLFSDDDDANEQPDVKTTLDASNEGWNMTDIDSEESTSESDINDEQAKPEVQVNMFSNPNIVTVDSSLLAPSHHIATSGDESEFEDAPLITSIAKTPTELQAVSKNSPFQSRSQSRTTISRPRTGLQSYPIPEYPGEEILEAPSNGEDSWNNAQKLRYHPPKANQKKPIKSRYLTSAKKLPVVEKTPEEINQVNKEKEIELENKRKESMEQQKLMNEEKLKKKAMSKIEEKGKKLSPITKRPKKMQLSTKSNKVIVKNALLHVCLAGTLNKGVKEEVLQDLNESKAGHFVILFRDVNNFSFRGLYFWDPNLDQTLKLYAGCVGPTEIDPSAVLEFYKYDSGARTFKRIPTRSFGRTVDAIAIGRDYFVPNK